jgi:hypothetical protein
MSQCVTWTLKHRICHFQVLEALSHLDVSSEVWQHILQQALDALPESNDEPLAAAMSFIFKAAAECQQLPHAVCPEDADLTFLS